MSDDKLASLLPFSTCDISDALCALGHLNAIGNIPNVSQIAGPPKARIQGLAYTAEFILSTCIQPKSSLNHVDSCPKDAILIIKAPKIAPNAVWGGLMTARAVNVGCKGAVICGKVRDVGEINEMGFSVWAEGTSTMGAAPFCKLGLVGEGIVLADDTPWPVFVATGDALICDQDGVVRCPVQHIEEVAEYCKKRTVIDQKCMVDIKAGHTIVETFAKHRK